MLNRRSLLKLLGLASVAPLAAKAATAATVPLSTEPLISGLEPSLGRYRNVRFISPGKQAEETLDQILRDTVWNNR